MSLDYVLMELGFTRDEDSKKAAIANAETQGLSANGAYEIQAVYVKGDMVITVEQNQAPEDFGDGMTALVSHPPLAIIASPKGRVAFNPNDVELARVLVSDFS